MIFPLDDSLDADALEALRERGKKLYGNRYRLEVAVAIGQAGETFYNHDVAETVRLPDSTVRRVILDLAAAGVIRQLGDKRGIPKFYERVRSSYWAACESVLTELVAGAAGSKPAAKT
jgi:hypothetical protein